MDDNTVEALREVLQDMTSAIELLQSGNRSGAALICFIEEMLKTIESWAVKYNVVLHDGSLASFSAQGLKPENHRRQMFPFSQLPSQELMGGPLDVAESMSQHSLIEGEATQQSIISPNQEKATLNPFFADDALQHSQIDVKEGGGWQPTGRDHSSGITSSEERRKTRSQASLMHIDVMLEANRRALICSPQSSDCLKSLEAGLGKESSEIKGDRIESPSWLPEGWIVETKSVGIGNNAGSKNKVYVDPTSNHYFQSKKEVLIFLGKNKRKRGRPRKTEPSKGVFPGNGNDTAQAAIIYEPAEGSNPEAQLIPDPSAGNDTPLATISSGVGIAKRKRGRPRKVDSLKNNSQADLSVDHANASVQACGCDESVLGAIMEAQAPSNISLSGHDLQSQAAVSSLQSPMNIVPLPHQSGQPSEWLVYESLESLPLSMSEHYRFENNSNKLAVNSSPSTAWPWMLGSSEDLNKPSTDIKINETASVGEMQQEEAGLTALVGKAYAPEVVPEKNVS